MPQTLEGGCTGVIPIRVLYSAATGGQYPITCQETFSGMGQNLMIKVNNIILVVKNHPYSD